MTSKLKPEKKNVKMLLRKEPEYMGLSRDVFN
jgi:hypothetical protein